MRKLLFVGLVGLLVWNMVLTLILGLSAERLSQMQDDLDSLISAHLDSQLALADWIDDVDLHIDYQQQEIRWLKFAQQGFVSDIKDARSEILALRVDNELMRNELEGNNIVGKPEVTPMPEENWIPMPGDWVVTWYGDGHDGFLDNMHGAAWNGLVCPDHSALSTVMPDVVTGSHYGGAMPGAEYYCMPIRLCIDGKCVVFTAVDVPADDRLEFDGKLYAHIDVWYQVAKDLGMIERGVVYENVEVYVGSVQ